MSLFDRRLSMRGFAVPVLVAVSVGILGACGDGSSPGDVDEPAASEVVPSAEPTAIVEHTPSDETVDAGSTPIASAPTPVPASSTPKPDASPAATPAPEDTPVAVKPLEIDLLSPRDGAGTEIGAIRVSGTTALDAVVAVNEALADVGLGGRFQRDIVLDEGANLLQIVATNLTGETASAEAVVFFVSPVAGLPFSLLYPFDGLLVTVPTVPVIGGSRLDAVVGVNGVPVEINEFGIFSAEVSLVEGSNLIEVLASDIEGNIRFQTVAVFYVP